MNPSNLEQRVYHSEYASGLLECFVGAALVLVGSGWLFGQVAIASAAPGMLAIFWPGVRSRLIAPRAGHVRFRPERQERERKGLGILVLLGVGTLAAALAAHLLRAQAAEADFLKSLVRGLPAALLGFGAVAAGATFGLRRLYVYAVPLLVAGALAIVLDFDPGWSLLGAGAVLLATGAAILANFLRDNPVL